MTTITVETTITNSIEKIWDAWNNPEHIVHWAFASDDWEAPAATQDLKVGGEFTTTMAAKDGSTSFIFSGTYTEVVPHEKIAYTIPDGRKVEVLFEKISDNEYKIVETFDPEHENSEEMQRGGWQAILDNFKKYAETL
ncbi:MAG TPA: SRPBCC domain-containing protein [Candidatus Paceibacterota bacterium]|jgi:uncharacterized protein YndB with AHSA1/START domain|nr:SRPBCC domain-containing protein [Candidatus Paceibacterota bacterium]